jgi:hypothetical protein
MTKEHDDNDNDNEEDYSVTSDDLSNISEKDLRDVFRALKSVGFRFYHED